MIGELGCIPEVVAELEVVRFRIIRNRSKDGGEDPMNHRVTKVVSA